MPTGQQMSTGLRGGSKNSAERRNVNSISRLIRKMSKCPKWWCEGGSIRILRKVTEYVFRKKPASEDLPSKLDTVCATRPLQAPSYEPRVIYTSASELHFLRLASICRFAESIIIVLSLPMWERRRNTYILSICVTGLLICLREPFFSLFLCFSQNRQPHTRDERP